MIQQYEPLIDREALAKDLATYTLGDGFFTEYKKTEEFEQAICKALNVKYCSVVNNGTISLSLALLALGVKPRDKVLVPNLTMMATHLAVTLIGAVPIVVDIDPRNLCMDLVSAASLIEGSFFDGAPIKAVIYVTFNGRSHDPVDYLRFEAVCKKNRVALVEDNAQAMGSCYNARSTPISAPIYGIGSFSFAMHKIITTGQGGALVTNSTDVALKIRQLKDFGRTYGGNDTHDEFGINSKFTELQAIMGLNQIQDLTSRIAKKKAIYNQFKAELASVDAVQFLDYVDNNHTPWMVDVYVQNRDNLIIFLLRNDIKTRAMYPEIVSQKIVHKDRFWATKSMAMASIYSKSGLWLPSSLTLTSEAITTVCNKIKEFYRA